jgi:hypothetical protein
MNWHSVSENNRKEKASKEKKGWFTAHGARCRGNTKEAKQKSNHENTKIGKHEKGQGVYETFFFRVLVPRQIDGGQASCFRDGSLPLAFLLGLAVVHWSTADR